MLHINKDQQYRAQVLLKRIEEYRLARIGLVQQLEELDVQARVVQREFSVLQNSLAPIGWLPEEVLAMVFEAGTHLERKEGEFHFAVLISHITRTWRNIALATPHLWATIRCRKPMFREDEPYPETGIERTAAFLARSGSLPMDLHISNFLNEDLQFLELIRNHYARCQHLSIMGVHEGFPLPDALACLPRQPAPFLKSFQFVSGSDPNFFFEFDEPLFPSGVPHLRTAQFHGIQLRTFHFCLGVLQSITSLSLLYDSGQDDDGDDDAPYTILRDSLMALPSLIHLEFKDVNWVRENPSRRPVVLPTLQSLRGYSYNLIVLSMIHAASLTSLILGRYSSVVHACKFHFPSLQHLVLLDVTRIQPGRIILNQFPSFERLTLQMVTDHFCVEDILVALGPGTREAGNNGHIPFPLLRTLALSSYNRPLDVAKLASTISGLQSEGIPIGKLMLPDNLLTQMGTYLEASAQLRKCVEIAGFRVDWPTPFDSERFIEP